MTTIRFTELKTLLNQDLSLLTDLTALLEQEQGALGENDMATLEALVSTKHGILDRIRDNAKEKIRHLVTAGFKPTSGVPSTFLQGLGDEDLSTLWQDVHQAMAQCQGANSINGQIITHLQKRTGRLSEIIRGVNPNQKLYGAGGREEAVSHKSVLASA